MCCMRNEDNILLRKRNRKCKNYPIVVTLAIILYIITRGRCVKYKLYFGQMKGIFTNDCRVD